MYSYDIIIDFENNPKIPLDVMIGGEVPRYSLPDPPGRYDWLLKDFIVRRFYRSYLRKPVRKNQKYVYHVREFKRGKKTIRRKVRLYITKRAVRRIEKWWVLAKHKRRREISRYDFVDTDTYVRKVIESYDLDYDEIEIEKYPPFLYTHPGYLGFNRYQPVLNIKTGAYDLIFLYYLIKTKGYKDNRIIMTSSSFYLGGEYTLPQIVKKFVPQSIATTKERLSGDDHVSFVGYIAFSATTIKDLEKGKAAGKYRG